MRRTAGCGRRCSASGAGLLDTGLDRRAQPAAELARERPGRRSPWPSCGSRAAAGRGCRQPLDELADLVVEGIRDGRFVIMLPSPRTEETLRSRLEKVLRNENPTEVHDLAL